jgi:O-antigen/teichoic acid export membrane protein
MLTVTGELEPVPVGPAPEIKRRPLTTDVLLTFGSKVAILVLNVVGTIIVARALGPSGRGEVAVAFSFTLLLIQFGSLGLQSANAYFAAREPAHISRILANTLWTVLGVGLLLILAGLGLYAVFPGLLRGLDALEIAVVLVGIPAALSNQLFQSILLAEGRMVAYNGIELAMNVAMVVALAVGLLALGFGVLGAIAILVSANLTASLAFLALLRHHRPRLRSLDVRLLGSMLRYGTRIYLAALLAYLVGRVNLLLVNSYLGSAAAGQFSIAVALAEGLHLLPTVVALNLFPRIASGDASADTGAVFRSLTLVYGLLCILTIPLAGSAIELLYGQDFSQAVTIYYWLLPGIFAYGMVSVLSYHFAGRGFPLEALLIWFVGVAVNLAIVFPLMSQHASVNTAAFAASVSYSLVLVLHMRMFSAESGGYRSLMPHPRETVALLSAVLRAPASDQRTAHHSEH